MALLFDPFSQTKLVLSGAEKLWFLFGVDATLFVSISTLKLYSRDIGRYSHHTRREEPCPVGAKSQLAF